MKAFAAVLVAATAAITAIVTPSAGTAPESTLVIRPGRAIGKFELGMTQQRLLRVAGRPRYVVPRGSSFGRRTVEWQYGFGAEYIVRLFGRPGQMRVTRVSTTVRRERTPQGIGPGTRERVLRRAYPSIRCERLLPLGVQRQYVSGRRECTLFSPSGRRTIFRSEFVTGYGVTAAEFLRNAAVTEVTVAAR
jgi:hypothetical protein